ncbi:MAG: helix-turn-helix domain-containing protein [Candidatus Coproplasma sp.]
MTRLPIGEFIAKARKEKGLTQREVADILGISNRTVSAWEQGRAYPDILSLYQLAEILGVTTDEILRGEKAESPQPERGNMQADEALTDEYALPNGEKIPPSTQEGSGVKAEGSGVKADGAGVAATDNYRAAVDDFAFRSRICTAVQCCGLLFLCGGIIASFFILWLGILLAVLGVCALVVATVVLCAFSDRAKKTVGLRYQGDIEGLNAIQRQCLLDIGNINARTFLVLGCCWFVLTLIFIALHRLAWLIPLIFGIIFLAVAASVRAANIKRYGNMSQLTALNQNGRLLLKCLAFTAIPVVLSVGAIVFFAFWRQVDVKVDYSGDIDGFVDYMHTATLSQENYSGNLPYGEYVLDLSAVTEEVNGEDKGYKLVRVHDYFFAVRNGDNVDLYVAEPDLSFPQDVDAILSGFYASVRQVSSIGGKVYDVRYSSRAVEYTNYVNVERTFDYKEENGVVTVTRTERTSYFADILFGCIIICAFSLAVCAAVYYSKRQPIPTFTLDE